MTPEDGREGPMIPSAMREFGVVVADSDDPVRGGAAGCAGLGFTGGRDRDEAGAVRLREERL